MRGVGGEVRAAEDNTTTNRTSFAQACLSIMKSLEEEQQKPRSISGLARDVELHRKTVEKCIELLSELEKNWFDIYRLKLQEIDDRRKIVSLERRTGLLSYPEDIQNLIIRTKHYGTPSKETYVIINLYFKDATTKEKATSSLDEDETVSKLVKQGQVMKTERGRFYLSKEGITIAKGAMRVYPELEKERSSTMRGRKTAE